MHPGLLCLAVRELLVDHFASYARLPLSNDVIKVMPDGKPPAYQGDWFIAVYGTDWSAVNDDVNRGLDYYLGVSCTLTRRMPYVPQDKRGPEIYAKDYVGMSAVCLRIIRAVALKTELFVKLQDLDEFQTYSDEENSYASLVGNTYEYLRFQRCDPAPVPVGGDWFSAKNEHLADEAGETIMGYTMTVDFGKSRCGVLVS